MENISEKIFYNDAGIRELEPKDKEFQKRKKEFSRAYEKLEGVLSDEQKELLNALYLCWGGMQDVNGYLFFKKGLRLGLRLGYEVCIEDEDGV